MNHENAHTKPPKAKAEEKRTRRAIGGRLRDTLNSTLSEDIPDDLLGLLKQADAGKAREERLDESRPSKDSSLSG